MAQRGSRTIKDAKLLVHLEELVRRPRSPSILLGFAIVRVTLDHFRGRHARDSRWLQNDEEESKHRFFFS